MQDKSKPSITIGTIGQSSHGKTTLTAAITKVSQMMGNAEFKAYDKFDRISFETDLRAYDLVDLRSHRDYIKGMIIGATKMDATILVAASSGGFEKQLRSDIELAHQLNKPIVAVYLNQIDEMDDPELLDLVELELRELLGSYGYPGDSIPIIRGSAKKVLESPGQDPHSVEYKSILELLKTIDMTSEEPVQEQDKPFKMVIEDVFSVKGRGIVVTGRIDRGRIKKGDPIEIIGFQDEKQTDIVSGVEIFHKELDEARAGDNVGLLLRGISSGDLQRGQVIAMPGTIEPHQSFEASVYVLRKEEGGRQSGFTSGHQPKIYINSADVPSKVRFRENIDSALPGENVSVEVDLANPLALEVGSMFALREGGMTIGAGVITRLLSKYREESAEPPGAKDASLGDIAEDEADVEESQFHERKQSHRYANVRVFDELISNPIGSSDAIEPNMVLVIRLDIGALDRESLVARNVPIDEHLPIGETVVLDVMVSSAHFRVGTTLQNLGQKKAVHGEFVLPPNGNMAITPAGEQFLYIFLQAPASSQFARARIGYYYRNHLVQSQLLVANIGASKSDLMVTTDFTLSQSLENLELLPKRPQISVLTNDNAAGQHHMVVRAGDISGKEVVPSIAWDMDHIKINKLVKEFRNHLHDHAPEGRIQSKQKLIRALKELAPKGYQLYRTAVPGQYRKSLYPMILQQENLVIQVARSTSSSWTFPWGWIYDITLNPGEEDQYMLCPRIEAWDGRSPLYANPCEKGSHAANTLCPFGFWGFRYPVELLASTSEQSKEIRLPDDFSLIAVKTNYDVEKNKLKQHLDDIAHTLHEKYPEADLLEPIGLRALHKAFGIETAQDNIMAIYFFCHGEREYIGDPNTFLIVGDKEELPTDLLDSWFNEWVRKGRKRWERIRPLVFINACHSVEVHPETYGSYQGIFVGAADAAGVIGTEVKVEQGLAMDVARCFFSSFFDGLTVGQSLQIIRDDLLNQGNILGLNYTAYCWSDLKITKNAA